MKCHLSTSPAHRSTLESDFKRFQDEIKFPCQLDFSFKTIEKCGMEGVIAAAYYWVEEIKANTVRVEFCERYFTQYEYEMRKFTMLHELVHAHQRTDSMYSCNKTWIELESKYRDIINKTDWSGHEIGREIARYKKELIYNTFAYIFEIWDEIFVIKNYPDFTEERLTILYDIVLSESNVNRHDSALYEVTKYVIFLEIIRAFFLKNLSEATSFSTKFEDICQKWIDKLKSITTEDEFETIMSFLKPLTDFTQYPDYANIENQYLRYIEYVWEH